VTRVLHYADLESAYDDPERIGRLAGLVRSRRDGETIVVGSGDNTGPGVLALKTNGRQSLDFFRAVDPDAETFGNHEFDYEPETTRGLVRESPQTWVCANAFDGDEPFAVEEGVVPWTVVGTTSSQVGVFGVASPDTGDISPPAASLSFTDPIDAARDAVAALRERDVDRVLGLSHCGDDDDLAAAIEADAICGGHYHEPREDVVAGTLVVRPGTSGEHLVEVDLDTDRPRRPGTPLPTVRSTRGSQTVCASGCGRSVSTRSSRRSMCRSTDGQCSARPPSATSLPMPSGTPARRTSVSSTRGPSGIRTSRSSAR
jgi:2',3'-cyclic-nucleotide 2'-phosphodiesterase (5'-nucleotidase family)